MIDEPVSLRCDVGSRCSCRIVVHQPACLGALCDAESAANSTLPPLDWSRYAAKYRGNEATLTSVQFITDR